MEYSYELYLKDVADSMGIGKYQKSNEADLSATTHIPKIFESMARFCLP